MRLADCYTLLEVAPGASLDEIKKSYRRLAFQHHPDLNPDDSHATQRFARLNEAYVVLSKNLHAGPASTSSGRATRHGKAKEREARRKEEPTVQPPPKTERPHTFSAKQEKVLRDILSDPFAKEVFADIFQKLKRGENPGAFASEGSTSRNFSTTATRPGHAQGLVPRLKNWAARQLDAQQIIHMPARVLIPGTTLRVQLKYGLTRKPRTVDVTIPPDFVPGHPIRLRGLGRHLGPWRGDLYICFLVG